MPLRAPVEEVATGKLEAVDIGDGGGEEQVVAGDGPVVPLLLARERRREVAGMQRMPGPSDRVAVEQAIGAAEQHGRGDLGLCVHFRGGGHGGKDTWWADVRGRLIAARDHLECRRATGLLRAGA